MTLSFNKIIKDVENLLKKYPEDKKKVKSYWDNLSEQVSQEGTWNKKLLDSSKTLIIKYLEKYSLSQLIPIWQMTKYYSDYLGDIEKVKLDMIQNDLAEEILDKILEIVGSRYEEDLIYAEDKEDDDEEDELFSNKDDDGFVDEDFFEDEDGY